jgi:hypothetical protein
MGDVLTILGNAAASPVTFWLAGLVASFRLIAPAEKFLSARSAAWLAAQIQGQRSGSMKRRFALAFKRYVDRTFDARQRRAGRCRFWLLSFWRCAAVSFLTFLAIYWLVVLSADTDAMLDEFRQRIAPVIDDLRQQGIISLSGGLLAEPGTMTAMFWASLFFMSLVGALANIVPDYLSFLETRNVLARMGRGVISDILLILLDFVLSALIALLAVFLLILPYVVIGESIKTGGEGSFAESFDIALILLAEAVKPFIGASSVSMVEFAPTQASVLSTFATSLWIWVFFSGMGLLRAGVLIAPVLRLVRFLVDVDDHPFRAAWLMFAILWSTGMGAATLVG